MARKTSVTNLKLLDQPQQGILEETNKPLVESLSNSSNNSGKVHSQGAMNSELSQRGKRKSNNNISLVSIRSNKEYNREVSDSNQLKLLNNQLSRNIDETTEIIERESSGNIMNNTQEGQRQDRPSSQRSNEETLMANSQREDLNLLAISSKMNPRIADDIHKQLSKHKKMMKGIKGKNMWRKAYYLKVFTTVLQHASRTLLRWRVQQTPHLYSIPKRQILKDKALNKPSTGKQDRQIMQVTILTTILGSNMLIMLLPMGMSMKMLQESLQGGIVVRKRVS